MHPTLILTPRATQAPPIAAARRGARDGLLLLAGYVPFALVVGITVGADGPLLARLLSGPAILGGSAQLLTLQLLDGGSPLLLVVGAGLITNARLVAYSAALAPAWATQPRWFRLLGAALLIDPTWALAQQDLAGEPDERSHRWYYLSEASVLVAGWSGVIALGAVAGDRLSALVGGAGALALAGPLSLAALVAPKLADRRTARVLAAALLVGWLTVAWPAGTGLLAAIAAAVAAGAVGASAEVEEGSR